MVEWEDMTEAERDQFVYIVLSKQELVAIAAIMKAKYGEDVSEEQLMRFAFKVARNKITPKHLKNKNCYFIYNRFHFIFI